MQSSCPNQSFNVSSQLRLPSVSVIQKLLLVIMQLLVIDCCIFVVRAFDDGIDRTGLLTVSTVYALCHIDVVACGPS